MHRVYVVLLLQCDVIQLSIFVSLVGVSTTVAPHNCTSGEGNSDDEGFRNQLIASCGIFGFIIMMVVVRIIGLTSKRTGLKAQLPSILHRSRSSCRDLLGCFLRLGASRKNIIEFVRLCIVIVLGALPLLSTMLFKCRLSELATLPPLVLFAFSSFVLSAATRCFARTSYFNPVKRTIDRKAFAQHGDLTQGQIFSSRDQIKHEIRREFEQIELRGTGGTDTAYIARNRSDSTPTAVTLA